MKKTALSVSCALVLCLAACSRQQSDWQKAREANSTDSYEQYLKKYPSGEFAAQAQARVKELYEERDWQKARDTDTPEAYQAFLKQYPEGKWTEEARIRVENFTLAQVPAGATAPAAGGDAAAMPPGPGVPRSAAAPTSAPSTSKSAAPSPPPAQKPAAPPVSAPAHATADSTPAGRVAHPQTSTAHAGRSKGSGYGVQLGAYKSGSAAAKQRWVRLRKEYPKLFTGLKSTVVAKKTAAGSVYRLQAMGLSEERARAVCAGLKAKAQPCVVVPPPAKG